MHLLEIDMANDQRASVQFDQRGSRTKGGVLEKKNYKTFFRHQLNPLNQEARKEIQKKILSRSMSIEGKLKKRSGLMINGNLRSKRIVAVTNGNRAIKKPAPALKGSEPSTKRHSWPRSQEPRASSTLLSVRKDLLTNALGTRTRSNVESKSEPISKTVPILSTTVTASKAANL